MLPLTLDFGRERRLPTPPTSTGGSLVTDLEDRLKELQRRVENGFKKGSKQFTKLWRNVEGQRSRVDELEQEVEELREKLSKLRRMYLYGETDRRRRPKSEGKE